MDVEAAVVTAIARSLSFKIVSYAELMADAKEVRVVELKASAVAVGAAVIYFDCRGRYCYVAAPPASLQCAACSGEAHNRRGHVW